MTADRYDSEGAGAPPTAPVALVWGESELLVREAAQELMGDARPTVVDGAEWRPGTTADLATPSLFGERRALLVTDAQDLPEEALAEIARYAERPEEGARLVLAARVSARAKGPPRALARTVGTGAEIRRAAVERRDLPGWVAARAGRHGIPARPQGAAALIATVGEDPAELDQALAQVAAAHAGAGLTPEAVAAQFRGFGDRRIWELCDAAFGRNVPAALRALTGLLEAREEPLAILGGIAARLRDLVRVRSLPPRTPPAEVAREVGLRFDWQARRYREQANRFSDEELASLHADLVEADRALKQGAAGDVVLPMLVGRIATGAAPLRRRAVGPRGRW